LASAPLRFASLFEGLRRRRNGDRANRTARPVDDLERRGDDDRARRRKLIQVAQGRQTEPAVAVHEVVVRERGIEARRLACVRPDRLDADAENVALGREELRTLLRPAGRVATVLTRVDECLEVSALRPAGPQQDPRPGGIRPCSPSHASTLSDVSRKSGSRSTSAVTSITQAGR